MKNLLIGILAFGAFEFSKANAFTCIEVNFDSLGVSEKTINICADISIRDTTSVVISNIEPKILVEQIEPYIFNKKKKVSKKLCELFSKHPSHVVSYKTKTKGSMALEIVGDFEGTEVEAGFSDKTNKINSFKTIDEVECAQDASFESENYKSKYILFHPSSDRVRRQAERGFRQQTRQLDRQRRQGSRAYRRN